MEKVFVSLLVALLLAPLSSRCYSENAITFVSPSLGISFPQEKSIIQFFNRKSSNAESGQKVAIYIQVPSQGNRYYSLYVGTVEALHPNMSVEIVSVFLENVDETPEKELFIITATERLRHGNDTEGREYDIYIFKHPGDKRFISGLPRLTEIEKQIGGGFGGIMAGELITAPYKNAADVRNILKRLGYLKGE